MRYLSNGDFGFPFTWPLFQVKQFYIWSYQSGALNADGVMRMPGRLLDLVVFMLFGNLAFEYFFIVTTLIIAFLSFYYFAHKFLNIQSVYTKLFGSLFFALNPVFLGNLSKIGLVLAAAMLPLCLAMVREVFEQKRFRYLFLWLLLLNISLVHPFTFAANFAVSGAYLAYQAWLHRGFVLRNWYKFVLAAATFLLLNAYFLLPLVSMQTVSKGVLSDTISSTPTDYTALVGVLNTGDIFTGLSLSKNVVKDYDFYNATYASLYFLGTFGFYALLIGLYVRVEKRMNLADRRRAAILLGSFLVLIALATVTFLHVDSLIRMLINTPGGWAFRSPLKWQLYLPFALFGLFVLFMQYVGSKKRRFLVYAGLVLTFVLMNGFLMTDVYRRLLVPRSVSVFNALQQMNLDHKNILFVNGSACWDYEQNNPRVMNELNQIIISQNTQVKRVSVSDIDQVNMDAYNYVLGCQGIAESSMANAYQFTRTNTFAGNAFQLYRNQSGRPYVYAAPDIQSLTSTNGLGSKHDFVSQRLNADFAYVTEESDLGLSVTHLQETFDELSVRDIRGDAVTATLSAARAGEQKLHIQKGEQPLFYNSSPGKLAITTVKKLGYLPVPATDDSSVMVTVPENKRLAINYTDPVYDYKNLIANGSLERGLWQKKVGDCYNFDNQPKLGMSLNTTDKTVGKRSLQLESASHIACTGPDEIPVTPGQYYLLSFDYWGSNKNAGYSVDFEDAENATIGGRLLNPDGKWQTFAKVITVPDGAHSMRLRVEAYPDSSTEAKGVARFDNFQLVAVPDVQGRFYLVDQSTADMQKPAKVDYKANNPTKTSVHVSGARTPFYLLTSETYSSQWRLTPSGSQADLSPQKADSSMTSLVRHFKVNGSMNGWYIDPTALCRDIEDVCRRNSDGTYDIDVQMVFAPQRWMYVGMLVSGVTGIGGTAYFVHDLRRDRRKGIHYKLWR